jgi:chromate transporter
LDPIAAGVLGSAVATWVTFAPCFFFIYAGAPFIERLRDNKPLSGALAGITAAVVGVILNLAIWFAIHTIFAEVRPVALGPLTFDAPVVSSANLWALLLSAAAIVAMFRFKVGMIPTLVACCIAGIVLYFVGATA